jgi:hypothetical protein
MMHWVVSQAEVPSPQSLQATSRTGQSMSLLHLMLHVSRVWTHLPSAQ